MHFLPFFSFRRGGVPRRSTLFFLGVAALTVAAASFAQEVRERRDSAGQTNTLSQTQKSDLEKTAAEKAAEIAAEIIAAEQAVLERKLALEAEENADSPSPEAPRDFDAVVSTASELVAAIKNASNGDVIALEDGTYRLDQSIYLGDKALTLVGKSGKKNAVSVEFSGEYTPVFAFINAKESLSLFDLTVKSSKNYAARLSNGASLTATRCELRGFRSAITVYKGGKCALNSCLLADDYSYPTAARLDGGSDAAATSIAAQDCEFLGNIEILNTSAVSTFKNCKIDANSIFAGVYMYTYETDVAPRCEIVDCEIMDGDGGVRIENGASATMRDVKMRDLDYGAQVSKGGQCEATNITFSNVDREWDIADDAGTVTRDGQRTPNEETISAPNEETPNEETPNEETPNEETPNAKTSNEETSNEETPNVDSSSPEAPRDFDRVVSTASELVAAIDNASNGDVIALEDGTYALSEEIQLENKRVTLVGKSGNRERVKITSSGKDAVFDIDDSVELILEDLSLEAKGWAAIYALFVDDSTVNATRCNITSLGGLPHAINSSARCVLKECDVVGAMDDGYRTAVNVKNGGSITAESCVFTGGVQLDFEPQPSSLKNCAIRDCGKCNCVDVNGVFDGNDSPRCELIDCQLEDAARGLYASNRGQITMRGGAIRHMRKDDISKAVYASDDGVIAIDDVEISDCSIGVRASDGGKCEATNLTFSDVDDKWRISDDATATHNGRAMTRND